MRTQALSIISLIILTLTAGCANRTTQGTAGGGDTLASFDEISLERTPCYGMCPAYRVVVHGDGRVEYDGTRYVDVTGHATATLSREQLTALAAAVDSARYFTLRDSYVSKEDGCELQITDNPGTITTVTIGKQTKTILHNYGCRMQNPDNGYAGEVYPRELTKLETRIDEIVGTAHWVGARK